MNGKRTVAYVLLALLLLCGPASASENLLANGDISSVYADGQPHDWARSMWNWDVGVSELTASEDAYMGTHALYVHNLAPNDARFEQVVKVKPDTCYRISAMVRAEGCDPNEAGASISIANAFVSSEQVHETHGAWRSVSFYGRTGADQHELTIWARLGGYGSTNSGKAWFDDLTMIEVDEQEAGGDAMSLSTLPPSGGSAADSAPRETPWTLLNVMLALAYVLVTAALLIINARRKTQPAPVASPGYAFLLIAAVALLVRVVLAVTVRGYGIDMNCFQGWAMRMSEYGPAQFYTPDLFCDYPPGYLYVLWLIGGVSNGLSIGIDSQLGWLLIKFIPIALDIVLAFLVFKAVRESYDDRVALLLAGLIAFNPTLITNSAVWGQIDSVLTVLLVVSMLMAARGRWFISLPAFALAILVKPQALLLAPLGLVMVVVEVVESDEKKQVALRLLGAAALSILAMLLLSLPFLTSLPEKMLPEALFGIAIPDWLKPVGFLINRYTGTMNLYSNITVNACNLYMLLGQNWKPLNEVPALTIFAYALMGLSFVYAAFLYVRAKDRGKIFLVSAMLLVMLFAVAPMMHERYLFPALAMLVMAYAFDRDARLLAAFVALSATQFVNMALVLQYMHLMPDGQQALYGAISVVNLMAAAFLGWTGWEMCVTGHTVSLVRVYKPALIKEDAERATGAVRESLLRPRDARLNLKRRDVFFMVALTLLSAALAFTNLGSTAAPQTQWRSTAAGEQITFDLGEVRDFRMTYFGGISDVSFLVEMSDDALMWSDAHYAEYNFGNMYRWLWYQASERDENGKYYSVEEEAYPMKTARYIRLTAEWPGLLLNEVAFLDAQGTPLPIASVYSLGGGEGAGDPTALIDEQRTVPPYPTYSNGMYFDELYHGRTAYEHLNGLHPYESTHPPLGKVLIMLGIQLFGMTPFGWRFVPAVFGVLMVPLMYLLGKQLFKRSSLALIGAFLMAVDCMHFTQSRFATLDAIAVFFIMLMYLFMIRYAQMSFYHQKLGRTLVPLALSGVSMGLAIATKWIGAYAALGLAFILFFTLAQRAREHAYAKKNLRTLDVEQRRIAQRAVRQFVKNLLLTLLFCVLFFVVIPGVIYYFSYYWHLKPDVGLSLRNVLEAQRVMFSYHTGGALEHDFSSWAGDWPFIVKPMWYYSGNAFMQSGVTSTITCMGNPVVWWGGFAAMVWMFIRLCVGSRDDRRYLYILVGFLSQYLPWFLISRSTFIYHYFASVPFIILSTVALFEWVRKRSPRAYKTASLSYCAAALILFAAFYPVISGLPAPQEYTKYLHWFGWLWYA